MRVPLSWLRELCDPGLSTDEIVERLDMTGTEVERVERIGVPSTDNFVVGKVLEAQPHPDADRLRVCRVDDGSGAERTIVCGAPNVAAGQTVAVALPGAVMPGGEVLGEVTLRGVSSSGMILAEDELGLGEDHAGIMVLPADLAAGAPLADHLPMAEEVLELEITPNRPDCLSVYGVARELHAATGAPLAEDPAAADAEPRGDDRAEGHVSIEIADPDVCPRFVGRVFEDVTIGPSPLWLRARLTAAGQRPISNVVDITNYAMLLTGQPMHAFDLDKVRGGRVVVRRAAAGETMTTLDGVERAFDPDTALVCDAKGPTSIAGIMGGQVSEVSGETTRVLMEAANWVGTNILRTSSRLGLRSEASTRFEKQLHPESAMAAERVAARLMVELCGARLVPGTIDVYPGRSAPRRLDLRLGRLSELLGTPVKPREACEILESLDFEVQEGRPDEEPCLKCTVPYFRDADVQREADLIEEVARLHGLEKIPVTLPARESAVGRLTREQRLRRRLEDALAHRGLREVVAWSFTSPDTLQRLRLGEEATLRLSNPMSEDQSVMRPLLLPGLLDAASHNAARGAAGLALFESAHVYRPAAPVQAPAGGGPVRAEPDASPAGVLPARERHHLGGVVTRAAAGTWRTSERGADFYAAKGLVGALVGVAGLAITVDAQPRPFLHPGRSATVLVDAQPIGWVGEVHPLVAREWGLSQVAAFEIDFDAVAELAPDGVSFSDVTSFPAVLQDIAVVVPEAVSAAEVEAAVRRGAGELLAGASVFDLYRGEQLDSGSKSLALRLEFRAPDRTLTDDEVAGLRAEAERELGQLGGRLRA